MPSFMSIFQSLFHSNEVLTFDEDTYTDEMIFRPNPFIVLPRATEHHHVITIMDFMRQDPHLNVWIQQDNREQVIHDPRFSLNSILITHS